MKDAAARFEVFLRKRGLRLTKQRAEILDAIFATHKHVTADDLYELLRQRPAADALRISRATVYRTLTLLEEGGFIQGLDLGREGGMLYEHVLGHEHHDHMVCLVCSKIIEFHDDDLEAVQEAAVQRHGFRAESHRLNVYGTCARCLAKEAEGLDGEDDDTDADEVGA